jgi:hypothetical protein
VINRYSIFFLDLLFKKEVSGMEETEYEAFARLARTVRAVCLVMTKAIQWLSNEEPSDPAERREFYEGLSYIIAVLSEGLSKSSGEITDGLKRPVGA